ncbi:unnamed protein product [Prorocentrum cordatum]|uniref:Uncharacterized protein n=1 Tax=Prorocentrum cordatum TaxID=2364126 RepID=A0ABN9S4Z4_9DINO|nr:unnamed protein product [Polarella glacialis]
MASLERLMQTRTGRARARRLGLLGPPAGQQLACAVPDGPMPPADAGDESAGLVDVFSRGSKNHHRGQCRPCHSNGSGLPCPRSETCDCCHYCHGLDKFLDMKRYTTVTTKRKRFGADAEWPTASASGEAPRSTQQETTQQDEWCATSLPVLCLPGVASALRHLSPQQLAAMLREAAPDYYED